MYIVIFPSAFDRPSQLNLCTVPSVSNTFRALRDLTTTDVIAIVVAGTAPEYVDNDCLAEKGIE